MQSYQSLSLLVGIILLQDRQSFVVWEVTCSYTRIPFDPGVGVLTLDIFKKAQFDPQDYR